MLPPRIHLRYALPGEIGRSPAAITYGPSSSPVIIIHRQAFAALTPFARRFVILHELGHYLLNTSSEQLADAFALGLLAGSQPYSLRLSLHTLQQLDITPSRMAALAALCLHIDRHR